MEVKTTTYSIWKRNSSAFLVSGNEFISISFLHLKGDMDKWEGIYKKSVLLSKMLNIHYEKCQSKQSWIQD